MTNSTTNSFSALGFEDGEAVVEALRADLADIARNYFEKSQQTQVALAKRLGIPQSTISAIKNDNIDRLSVEFFVRILSRAGIPWTAKCWAAPHDPLWVSGGISQLLAAIDVPSAKPLVKTSFWDDVVAAGGGPLANFQFGKQIEPSDFKLEQPAQE